MTKAIPATIEGWSVSRLSPRLASAYKRRGWYIPALHATSSNGEVCRANTVESLLTAILSGDLYDHSNHEQNRSTYDEAPSAFTTPR